MIACAVAVGAAATQPRIGRVGIGVILLTGPALAAAGLLALALDRTAGIAAVGVVAIALGFGAPRSRARARLRRLSFIALAGATARSSGSRI